MRFIEIDLDGDVVRALLNDAAAPKTTDEVWNALPFGGKAVHAQVSGQMFRMLDETPVSKDLELESPEFYHHPGQVIYFPPIREIAFAVGESMFAASEQPFRLTPLAEIEGNAEDWFAKGDRIQFTGTIPIEFRQAADQATPFRYPTTEGRKIEIDFEGVVTTATLLDKHSPRATAAFLAALPLEGRASNSTWGAKITRFWAGGEGGRLDLRGDLEAGTTFHYPGYVYFDPDDGAVRIVYGSGREGLPWQPARMIPVARFDGDIAPYRQKASSQLLEGAKPMSIRLKG
jgi:hypothetical protein